MKRKIIKKGRHRPSPFRIAAFHPIFLFNKKYFDREFSQYVIFGSNCKYNIGIDQHDWNKLTGVCLGIKGPHHTSYRLAWRWREDKQAIEICAYYYSNGTGWTSVRIGYIHDAQPYKFSIKLKARDGRLTIVFSIKELNTNVEQQTTVYNILNDSPCLGFGCGLYFGGNRTAPHEMEFYMSEIQ